MPTSYKAQSHGIVVDSFRAGWIFTAVVAVGSVALAFGIQLLG